MQWPPTPIPGWWMWLYGWLFAAAMWTLAFALAAELLAERRAASNVPPSNGWKLKAAILAGLFLVPLVLGLSASRAVYAAVNPHSGGATGWRLLGSTLGIVVIFIATPAVVGVWRKPSGSARASAATSAQRPQVQAEASCGWSRMEA